MTSFHIEPALETEMNYFVLKWNSLTTFLEENRQNIFYLFLFYVITIALFVERFIRKYNLYSKANVQLLNTFFSRLFLHGRTHRSASHNGCWNCHHKRLSSITFLLLQHPATHNVEKSTHKTKRILDPTIHPTRRQHPIP